MPETPSPPTSQSCAPSSSSPMIAYLTTLRHLIQSRLFLSRHDLTPFPRQSHSSSDSLQLLKDRARHRIQEQDGTFTEKVKRIEQDLVEDLVYHSSEDGIEVEGAMMRGMIRMVRLHNKVLERKLDEEVKAQAQQIRVPSKSDDLVVETVDIEMIDGPKTDLQTPPDSPQAQMMAVPICTGLEPMSRELEKAFHLAGMPGEAVDELWRVACVKYGLVKDEEKDEQKKDVETESVVM